jgi:hypothetical protein
VNELVLDDGKPVDNIFSEKQMRLLTQALHDSWAGPPSGQPFVVMANVGVFHTLGEPPIVPDVLLAVGVRQGSPKLRENLAYFVWLRGKVPDVVIEIVSNREGGEDTTKLEIYARIGVPYYVIFDPENELRGGVLRVLQLQGRTYQALPEPSFFSEVGLGIKPWQGRFEDLEASWLRWCDRGGSILQTGAERVEKEQSRADSERQRADTERQRAESERQRADSERQRADSAEQRVLAHQRESELAHQELQKLKEQLRALGISPPP